MSNTDAQYSVRIALQDGKAVSAGLQAIGADGQKSFNQLAKATVETNAAFEVFKKKAYEFLGPAALEEMVRRSIGALNELRETAEKIDMPTDKLQELQFASVSVTGAVGPMDQALVNFTANVGAAQTGIGKFLPVLKDFGIEYKGLSNAQVFDNVVDAIHHAKTAQDALFISVKAFGDGPGKELVNVFRQGTDGLADFAAQAHKTGAVIDDSLIRRAAEMEKSFAKAWLVMKVNGESAIVSILSNFGAVLDKMDEVEKKAESIFPSFGKSHLPFADSLFGAGNEVHPPSNGGFNSPLQAAAANEAGTVAGRSFNRDEARKSEESIQKQIEGLKQINQNIQESDELQQVYNELRKNSVDLDSRDGQEIKYLVDQHIGLVAQQKLAAELAKDFSDAIEEAVTRSKSLGDVLRNLGTTIESQLLKSLMSPLATAGGNFFNSILSSFGWGDYMTPHAMGGVFGPGGSVPLKRYSSGGVADSPQVALFGEGSSNEAYVPLPDGRSIPVTFNGAAGGGQTVSLTLTINDYAGVSVEAQKSASGQGIDVTLRNATNQSILSGGLNQAMGAQFGLTPSKVQR